MSDLDHGGDLSDDYDPVTALAGPLMKKVLNEVALRRQMDDGEEGFFRDYADGTGGRVLSGPTIARDRQAAREAEQRMKQAGGRLTWRHQMEASALGVIAEDDDGALRARLVALAALSVAWVEALDRRKDEKRIALKRRLRWPVRLRNWLRDLFRRRF